MMNSPVLLLSLFLFVLFADRPSHCRSESSYLNIAWIYIILQCNPTFGQSLRRVNSFYGGNEWLNAVRKRYHVRIDKYLTPGAPVGLKTRGPTSTFRQEHR